MNIVYTFGRLGLGSFSLEVENEMSVVGSFSLEVRNEMFVVGSFSLEVGNEMSVVGFFWLLQPVGKCSIIREDRFIKSISKQFWHLK